MTSKLNWASEAVPAEDALRLIQSGMKIFVHGACATPTPLLESLCAQPNLENIRLYHMHTSGEVAFARPEHSGRFLSISLFTGPDLRSCIAEGRADFMPIFLSDIPELFLSRQIQLDAALVQLSPPDRHGQCSLGTSVDCAKAAVDSARIVIAEINEQMPRTLGNSAVPLKKISAFIHTNRPLVEHACPPGTHVESQIGAQIAELIEDGSTLQTGIGTIPNAVLARLANKTDLGIHTEMLSDGVIDLIEGGIVTNRLKTVHPGRSVTSFVAGTKRLFDFIHDNPLVEFHPCDRTNDTALIRKNDKAVAINSALQVDLSGQVCADSIGHRIYSGIGGQMDFMRGAALSRGGKAILALPSTAAKGRLSRIVAELNPGSGVVTTRGHVHWVITEYGAVNLHGLALRQRGEALISVAHPDFRAELTKEFRALRHFPPL
jgi:4-hydroxybutyrate CoA-transferase